MEAARQVPDSLSFSSFCGPQPGDFQGPDYGKLLGYFHSIWILAKNTTPKPNEKQVISSVQKN